MVGKRILDAARLSLFEFWNLVFVTQCPGTVSEEVAMLDELWNRIQREVKANGKKAAVLGLLLLFGCTIWVPMLMKAFKPTRAVVASAVVPNQMSVAGAINTASAELPAKPGEFWSKLANTLADDPLFQTADIQSIARNPFQNVEIPEPLPVLFADEPVVKAPADMDELSKRLELRSTVVGRTRRAAMINGQLYQLGRKIEADGQQYLLTKIESHRVELSSGDRTIELTLARPQLKNILNRNESPGSPQQ